MPSVTQITTWINSIFASFKTHKHTGTDSQQISYNSLTDTPDIFTVPILVSNGGTGKSSLLAYRVVTGGTTSTGALQQVSGTGTTGQVLTSAGTGALPTWTQTVYGGSVGSGGTALSLPSGWTSGKNSTGNYTVTHGLGTSNYNVVASILTGQNLIIQVTLGSIGTSGFGIEIFSTSGTHTDEAFSFILVLA